MQILMGCCPAAKTSGLVSRCFSTVLIASWFQFLLFSKLFFFQITAFPAVWFFFFSSLFVFLILSSFSECFALSFLHLSISLFFPWGGNLWLLPLQLLKRAGISFTGRWFEGKMGGLHLRERDPYAPTPQLPLLFWLWHFSFPQSPAIIKNDVKYFWLG